MPDHLRICASIKKSLIDPFAGFYLYQKGAVMFFNSPDGFNTVFAIFPILFLIVFIFIFVIVIANVVKSAKRWKLNNDSPVLTVNAKVVTKRSDVSYRHHNNMSDNSMNMGYSSTYYYVTFEVASGDRMEFQVADTEYGMVTEGDHESLTFQGTRYLSFVRDTRI